MIAFTELHGCLVLSALMFGLGLTAAFTRRNTILVLIGVELMLNAANINFIAFWRHAHPGDIAGPLFVMFSMAVAAAEAAVGLSLLLVVFRKYRTTQTNLMDELKG